MLFNICCSVFVINLGLVDFVNNFSETTSAINEPIQGYRHGIFFNLSYCIYIYVSSVSHACCTFQLVAGKTCSK